MANINNTILNSTKITKNNILDMIEKLLQSHIDFGDLYFESSEAEFIQVEDSIVKTATYSKHLGVGVRAVIGEKTGFAYSNEIEINSILKAISSACSITTKNLSFKPKITQKIITPAKQLYDSNSPLQSLSSTERVEFLRHLDNIARTSDKRIKEVFISLSGGCETILIANTDGSIAEDIRPSSNLQIKVFAESDGRREGGSGGGGSRSTYDFFIENNRSEKYIEKAVKQALTNLTAIQTPAKTMPVVLGAGWSGVILHEAIGHGLEGDFIRKGFSAFSERFGEKVANEECTIVDDGTIPLLKGSLNIDDEGTPTQRTVLIENGILKSCMLDKMNAKLMNMNSTGNAKRSSYADVPMPRMTNTFMLPGKYSIEDIISSVDYGLYAVDFSGGQVDITSGKFVFSTSEAYLIKNGKISSPVKGATLIGDGPTILHHISMVGNDFAFDTGSGSCGKSGQSVPVGVGQPSFKIDALTVGGSA